MKKIIDWVAIILTVLIFVWVLVVLFSLFMTNAILDVFLLIGFIAVYLIITSRAEKVAKEKGWIK